MNKEIRPLKKIEKVFLGIIKVAWNILHPGKPFT